MRVHLACRVSVLDQKVQHRHGIFVTERAKPLQVFRVLKAQSKPVMPFPVKSSGRLACAVNGNNDFVELRDPQLCLRPVQKNDSLDAGLFKVSGGFSKYFFQAISF